MTGTTLGGEMTMKLDADSLDVSDNMGIKVMPACPYKRPFPLREKHMLIISGKVKCCCPIPIWS